MSPRERHLAVRRTARYHTLGEKSDALRQVWFVLHGHGQLSGFFIRHFAPLKDDSRLIVAPEALNRFYLEPTSWQGAGQARVGATWMTREDRLVEIEDYVRYLDALQHEVLSGLDRRRVRVVLLGFSQGVATALRWSCLGRMQPDLLVAWAGALPMELDEKCVAHLRGRVVRVIGNGDDLATEEAVTAEDARWARLGLGAETVRFNGGHELNAEVLLALV
ncbi:MAG: alpha/beta hydrolase [Gemmatimonadales bacterium]